MAGATIALAACAPAEPPVLAREPAAALVSAPLQPTPAYANTQLRELIENHQEQSKKLIEQQMRPAV